jgi:hypothetical protein
VDGSGRDGKKPPFTDEELRAYFASVVGQFRAPFGKRGGTGPLTTGQSRLLSQNTTKTRVFSVTVTRSDVGGAATAVIFSQNQSGAASNNDYGVNFTGVTKERFILNPGDQLSVQIVGVAPATFVVGQETF